MFNYLFHGPETLYTKHGTAFTLPKNRIRVPNFQLVIMLSPIVRHTYKRKYSIQIRNDKKKTSISPFLLF